MKTLLTTALFVLFSVCSIKAQSTFGLKGGPNLAYMSIDNTTITLLFHAGAFSEIQMSDKFFLRPELLYSRKGSKQTLTSTYDLDIAVSYVSIPVLAGWKASDRLSLLVGPEINYTLDGRLYLYDDQKVLDASSFEDWDVAIDLGMAYRITRKFSAEIRYSLGLINVMEVMFTDLHGRPIGSLNEGKNRTLQLSLSYALGSNQDL
jgi:hypothetical protein